MNWIDPAHVPVAEASPRVRLGPFVLERKIGCGGMGEVWRAVHADEHVPVAVKVIGPQWARQASYRAAFEREVRAIAGLVHPGIVAVHDQGLVDTAAAAASGGALAASSPYLVMEYMPRGSLEGLLEVLDWPLLQVLLREILGALAHAHARGLVHCDLKPGNVLLAGTAQVAFKLTDFGVAHTLAPSDDSGEDGPVSAGTPAYMAPEQLLGQWRDFGPWTDLYALGCMVWELCCGVPPFVAAKLIALAQMHLHTSPGVFAPRFAVPPGVEGWLRRLLAKRGHQRFACAADAAWALAQVGGPPAPAVLPWASVATRSAAVRAQAPTHSGAAVVAPPTEGRWLTQSTLVAVPVRVLGPGEGTVVDEPALAEDAGMSRVATKLAGPTADADAKASPAGDDHGDADASAATRLAMGVADQPAPARVTEDPAAAATRLAVDSEDVARAATRFAAIVDDANSAAAATTRPVLRDLHDAATSVAPAPEPSTTMAVPPVPTTWRGPGEVTPHRPLHGVGLALYRFREVPLVGREAERDALWAALTRVHDHGGTEVVLLRGPSGVGKSRLAWWLVTRSDELGAATVLRASHGPFGGPGEGLPRMLSQALHCVGLPADAAYTRIAEILHHEAPSLGPAVSDEAAALTELILPDAAQGERPMVRLHEQRERTTVWLRTLRRLGHTRPVLVWLEDAMWGPEALGLARQLVEDGSVRGLVVCTIRDDVLAERPAEAEVVAALAKLPRVTNLEVLPLSVDDHRMLICERLGLDAGLVDRVLARAGGNPLFSVQVVGDWVTRGLLERGPHGFTLCPGANLELPDDLQALWQGRLARLLAQHYAPAVAEVAQEALELAAALGLEIDPNLWHAACAAQQLVPPTDLVELLIRQRLAIATASGWGFVHGMLREAVEDLAVAAGRHTRHHRTWATLLQQRGQGFGEEVARHAIAAGDLAEALPPLLDAAYQLQISGQYDRAEGVLAQHAAVADRLGLAPDDQQRLQGRMQRVWLTWMRGGQGSLALARVRCREVEAVARRLGRDDVLGEALRWHGMVARFDRRFDESLAALHQAAAAFARAGDDAGQARTALALSVTLRALGQLAAAEDALATAERLAVASGLTLLVPRIAGNLAEIALQRGDWPIAEDRFTRALAAAEASGDRKALALTLGGAGDLHLACGAFAAADAAYARAEALFEALGSRYVLGIRLQRATVQLLAGNHAAAAPGLQQGVAARGQDPLQQAQAHLGLAEIAGHASQHAAFAAHVAAAEKLLAPLGETRRVIVELMARCAALAPTAALREALDRMAALHRRRLHAPEVASTGVELQVAGDVVADLNQRG